MGTACVGCSGFNFKKPSYSLQPSDTLEYLPQKLPYKLQSLKFQGQIDNVQILNYPWDVISIKFSIDEIMECYLPKKRNQNSRGSSTEETANYNILKWKFTEKFQFSLNQYQLRKSFLKVSFFRQGLVPILTLNLNLYSIVTGPYHHDLLLDFGKTKYSRILFDFKISQKCKILMNPLDVKIELNQQFPGEQFSYSFNVFSCRKKVCTTEPSLPKKSIIFSNIQGTYRELKEEDECQSPTKIRKGKDMSRVIKTVLMSKLSWQKPEKQNYLCKSFKSSSQIADDQENNMPSFKFTLKSSQINKSSIQFVLWDICLNNSNMKSHALMFAETYIPLMKIFQTEYQFIEELQTDSQESQYDAKKILKKLECRICQWSQNLVKDGKIIGKISLKFKIINQIHFSQMHLHARTQDGIIYMTSMFKTYAGNQGYIRNNKNIILITQNFQGLIQLLVKFNSALKDYRVRRVQNLCQLEEQIGLKFMKIHDKLTKSYQQSFVLNQNSKVQSMIQCQNILLNIVERIYIFLSDDNTSKFSQNCWKILLAILKRGQFYLEHLGFTTSNDQNIQEDLKQKKIKVGLKYMEMVYKILTLALNQNADQSVHIIPQAQAFKAYCYFRIPKFRQQLLKTILKVEDDKYVQDKISDLFDNEKLTSKNYLLSEEKSSIHLDWEKYFYSHLQIYKQSFDLNQSLLEELHQNEWMKNIAKRQKCFYRFIDYFAKKIKELGKRLKLTRYSYCPGYNKIIKCFLAQMKKKTLIQYQSSMVQTSIVLMINQNLINIIFSIIAEKTNIMDNNCFLKSLNITSSFLKFLTDNTTKILPQKFSNSYFFKVIKNVLECQYSVGVAKMLVIIYTYFQCFNEDLRQIISLFLLSKAFFKLFFHWSFNVRIIFYHLFLIKIYWGKINGVTQKQNKMRYIVQENNQTYHRYKILVKILNSVQFQKNQQKKQRKRQQKQEYYIKMRNKLRQKKKIGTQRLNDYVESKSSSSQPQVISSQNHVGFSYTHLTQNRLKRSQTLCSSQIKNYLKAFAKNQEQSQRTISCTSLNNFDNGQTNFTNVLINKPQNEIQKYCINLKLNKKHSKQIKRGSDRNSFSTSDEFSTKQGIKKINEQLNLNPPTLTKRKESYSEEKQLLYSFSGHEDCKFHKYLDQLQQMSLNQSNTVLLAMGQFREAQSFVQKYILQKGVAPHINLDPQIQLDSNQPRPF